MSNVDINVDRRTDGLMDGRTDGQKIGRLYRTLLQAGAIKITCNPFGGGSCRTFTRISYVGAISAMTAS